MQHAIPQAQKESYENQLRNINEESSLLFLTSLFRKLNNGSTCSLIVIMSINLTVAKPSNGPTWQRERQTFVEYVQNRQIIRTQAPDCSVSTGQSGVLLVLKAHSSVVIKLEGFTPSAHSTHSASPTTFCVLTFTRMLSPINYPKFSRYKKISFNGTL